ncbi:MAG: GNAT family N-acetyltransferase [Rhodocyclaceae bacterium]|nr:GNAT family N-acetyltransferase [Rhodocyclaceae bacterium]
MTTQAPRANGLANHGANALICGHIDTQNLRLVWNEAAWDSRVFGYPVLQVVAIEVRSPDAACDLTPLIQAIDASGCGLVSCRLAHDKLRESMLLEEIGFRFIEMLYQPTLDLAKAGAPTSCDHGMTVSTATEQDMPRVLAIAGSAFQNERIHMDPRLPSRLGDMRYQNWARDALTHSSQRLKILREKNEIVAFFVTEDQPDKTCYWHLNAVAPDAQGRGVGRRTWRAMLEDAQLGGAKRVQTSIVARNNRVLNLYASLAFTFPPPLMTFHWVRRT